MRKAIFILISFVLTASLPAGDTVYLKNGRSLQAENTWKEGDKLNLETDMGVITVPLTDVESIEKSYGAEVEKAKSGAPEPEKQFSELPETGIEVSLEEAYELETVLRENPENRAVENRLSVVYNELGLKEMRTGNDYRAESHFRSALMYNDDPVITANLATALINQERFYEARDLLMRAVLNSDENVNLLLLLSKVYYRLNDLEGAREELEAAYRISPSTGIRSRLDKIAKEIETSGDYRGTRSSHFEVMYSEKGEARKIDEILDFLEDEYDELTSELSIHPGGRITLIVYPTTDFHEITGTPDWVGGTFDGKIRIPTGGLTRLTQEFKGVLTHEFTHSLIFTKTGGNCPRWLHEGLAQYAEGKTARRFKRRVLNSGGAGVPHTWKGIHSYLPSLSFVEFLIDEYGFHRILMLLDNLSKNMTVEEGANDAFHRNLESLKNDWMEYLGE